MKFRPCIDLHQGKVKQIVGGTLTDTADGLIENFVAEQDAAYYAELFKRDGLTGGHIIMLGPGNEDAALQGLRAYPGGLQVGGGINPENAEKYLEAGASHVIVTSYIFSNGELDPIRLDKMVAAVGRERLVLDLSCRLKDGVYYVVTDRWQTFTSCVVNRETLEDLAGYCDEFLIHGVDVEGKRQGVQEELVQLLGEWAPIPVTYAGGARNLEDLELVKRLGRGKVDLTIGSALDIFGGTLPYRVVLAWQEGQ
ncbi:MAG TPA: phosphoribosylformimino-5-aminoimidazole carboxamide ribotide isomerase [Bacillota bacterium]|nr:phosphoribosylformimino-5-aminoimidazole carboxamide ribotide isomerase [Bacillota bacterium]HPT86251.1 phosphoribosylformimino-5-aminoimidazole carboxamide ribotide isomerase [Bacillota bacterium]